MLLRPAIKILLGRFFNPGLTYANTFEDENSRRRKEKPPPHDTYLPASADRRLLWGASHLYSYQGYWP
jgi:hypothetical protein